MANKAPHPYGKISHFEVSVHDRKLTETSPIETWISMTMKTESGTDLMLSLCLADTHDKSEADEIERNVRQIEKLLDDHLRLVVLQTLE